MPLWLLIPLAIYVIGVVTFLVMIYAEAPKQKAEVGVLHYLVALAWPGWGAWYVCLVIGDWYRRWRNK